MINHNLKIFLAVARARSITDAANGLYISQPSVSQSIKALEKSLNVKLFHRDKKQGLILTDVGEKIYLTALEMQHLEEQLYQTAFRENNFLGGLLRIGALPILTATILPKPLHTFKTKYPNVNIELMEGTPSEVRKMVEQHQVDFALTCSPFGKLDHETLLRDKMVGILPDGDTQKVIDLRENIEHLILARAGSETAIEELMGRYHLDFSKNILTTSGDAVIRLVQAGNGRGIISEFTLKNFAPEMEYIPVIPEVKFEIGIQSVDLDDLTPVAQEFVRILKESVSSYCL